MIIVIDLLDGVKIKVRPSAVFHTVYNMTVVCLCRGM